MILLSRTHSVVIEWSIYILKLIKHVAQLYIILRITCKSILNWWTNLIVCIWFVCEGGIQIELIGKDVKVNKDMAIFITMNPGYAGRSNLPDNLKKLFRSLAMTTPNRQLIAQVMLYSRGFRTAEKLASKIVPFFRFVVIRVLFIIVWSIVECNLILHVYL